MSNKDMYAEALETQYTDIQGKTEIFDCDMEMGRSSLANQETSGVNFPARGQSRQLKKIADPKITFEKLKDLKPLEELIDQDFKKTLEKHQWMPDTTEVSVTISTHFELMAVKTIINSRKYRPGTPETKIASLIAIQLEHPNLGENDLKLTIDLKTSAECKALMDIVSKEEYDLSSPELKYASSLYEQANAIYDFLKRIRR